MYTSNTSLYGEHPGIYAVLKKITDNIVKKLWFNIFCEKLGNYILREVTNTSDLLCVVRYIKYPIKYFENKQNPKSIIIDYLNYAINVETYRQRVKNYVNIEAGLRSNFDKMYSLVWGQFSHGINTIIRNNEDLKYKLDIFDCLWIL